MNPVEIRQRFICYLNEHYNYAHPNTMASNVFYSWHNDIGMDFWDIFKSEQSMQNARRLLITLFEKIGRKDPKGHASVHYGCWCKFREFLLSENIIQPEK